MSGQFDLGPERSDYTDRAFRSKGASAAWWPRARFRPREVSRTAVLICLRDGIVTWQPKREAVRGALTPRARSVRRRRTRLDLLTDPHYLIAVKTPVVEAQGLVRSLLDWQLHDVYRHARKWLDMNRTEMSNQYFRDRQ